MSSIVKCPHCNGEFTTEPLEEILNPTLTISKTVKEASSWEEIADMIDKGQAYRLFNVGDSIKCRLNDGSDIFIDIGGIDVYGQGEVIFTIRNSFGDYEMNSRSTNNGGFPQSKMLRTLDEILKKLPEDLQRIITPRHITQEFRGGKFECDTKLWLPSIYEALGERAAQYSCESGEKQIPFFKNIKNRIKLNSSGNDTVWWWLRSPYVGYATYFWLVYTGGYCGNSYGASYSYGVCPCFIISKRSQQVFVAE